MRTKLLALMFALSFSFPLTPARADTSIITETLATATKIYMRETDFCALTSAKKVVCWGNNDYWVLGHDGTDPAEVEGLSNVTSLALGGAHTCALTTSGAVWCWGSNKYGQVGVTGQTVYTRAIEVIDGGITQIEASYLYTCALTTSGILKCWGHAQSFYPGRDCILSDHDTPTTVPQFSAGIKSFSIGTWAMCAVTASGGVVCKGARENGYCYIDKIAGFASYLVYLPLSFR